MKWFVLYQFISGDLEGVGEGAAGRGKQVPHPVQEANGIRNDSFCAKCHMILGKGMGSEWVGPELGSSEGVSFAGMRMGLVDCAAGASGAGGVAGGVGREGFGGVFCG